MNNIYFIIIAIIIIIYVGHIVRKEKFSIKESFWWMFGSFIMLILAIFPHTIDWCAKKIGIAYPPSLLFILCIIFLLFINFRNSKRIAELQVKIVDLGQEVSILREKSSRGAVKDEKK